MRAYEDPFSRKMIHAQDISRYVTTRAHWDIFTIALHETGNRAELHNGKGLYLTSRLIPRDNSDTRARCISHEAALHPAALVHLAPRVSRANINETSIAMAFEQRTRHRDESEPFIGSASCPARWGTRVCR